MGFLFAHFDNTTQTLKFRAEAKVDKMVEAAKKLCPAAGWRTGTTVDAEVRAHGNGFYLFLFL